MSRNETWGEGCWEDRRTVLLLLLPVLLVFLVVRGVAWSNSVLLEDHDSVGYLWEAQAWRSLDPERIARLSPDSAPLFPMSTALFSLPGWGFETAARFGSLLFSCLAFAAVWVLGRRFADPLSTAVGLAILACSPALIPLSFSVLSEPAFIAMVYLALALFWSGYEDPVPWKAALCGLAVAGAFLARTEGLIFLGIVPAFQLAHFVLVRPRTYTMRRLVAWGVAFGIAFTVPASLQLWDVSRKMGHLALNGREVWIALLNNPDGKSHDAKIYGLDFSPERINLEYLQANPDAAKQFESGVGLRDMAKLVVDNFNRLYSDKLGVLLGPLVLVFFGIGLLALFERGRRFDVLLILGTVVGALIGPFMHSVPIPHIAVIAPIAMLVAGVGIVRAAGAAVSALDGRLVLPAAAAGLALVLAPWAIPLYGTMFNPKDANEEYSPNSLAEPARIVRELAERELGRPPRITARKNYLTYLTEGQRVALPFTDARGLATYAESNDVDFVFLERALIEPFPFLTAFDGDGAPPGFRLLYRGAGPTGAPLELYRFEVPPPADPPRIAAGTDPAS